MSLARYHNYLWLNSNELRKGVFLSTLKVVYFCGERAKDFSALEKRRIPIIGCLLRSEINALLFYLGLIIVIMCSLRGIKQI
jgi:hypothetical protein